MFNVTANSNDSHIVQALEVVAHVELVEVEGDAELRIAGREVGGSDKGNCEVRAISNSVVSVCFLRWILKIRAGMNGVRECLKFDVSGFRG